MTSRCWSLIQIYDYFIVYIRLNISAICFFYSGHAHTHTHGLAISVNIVFFNESFVEIILLPRKKLGQQFAFKIPILTIVWLLITFFFQLIILYSNVLHTHLWLFGYMFRFLFASSKYNYHMWNNRFISDKFRFNFIFVLF